MTEQWKRRVEEYFRQESFLPLAPEAWELLVPEDLIVLDLNGANCAETCFYNEHVSTENIRDFYNLMAQYYETKLMISWQIERDAIAYLAQEISSLKPKMVADAGCGTGLALAFLAQNFPEVQFIGWDISEQMLFIAEERIDRLELRNVELFTETHDKSAQTTLSAPDHLNPGVDLLICKCAFYNGTYTIPDFSDAPAPSLAFQAFMESDPTMIQWADTMSIMFDLTKRGGTYIEIGAYMEKSVNAVLHFALDAGFASANDILTTFTEDLDLHKPHKLDDEVEDLVLMSPQRFKRWVIRNQRRFGDRLLDMLVSVFHHSDWDPYDDTQTPPIVSVNQAEEIIARMNAMLLDWYESQKKHHIFVSALKFKKEQL